MGSGAFLNKKSNPSTGSGQEFMEDKKMEVDKSY